MGRSPPRAPRPARLHSHTRTTASADYRVDCCLKSPNGGHLRPGPGASLYFFVRPIPTLQSTEPATVRAHRTPRACFRPIGSGSAMSWRRRWPTHGGRGPKPLEGRAAGAYFFHFGCCVCVVVVCRAYVKIYHIVYFYIRTFENLENVGLSRHFLRRHLQFCVGATGPSGQN